MTDKITTYISTEKAPNELLEKYGLKEGKNGIEEIPSLNKWYSINTAPKDGTIIRVYLSDFQRHELLSFKDGKWISEDGGWYELDERNYWQPKEVREEMLKRYPPVQFTPKEG